MNEDQVILQSFMRTKSNRMDTDGVSNPEQEQKDISEPDAQPELNQGTLEPVSGSPQQVHIELRMKQLHNRRFLLLKMQNFKKKAEERGVRISEELTCEDNEQLCELEAIQKELEELQVQKKEWAKQGNHSKVKANEGQQDAHPTAYKIERPRGGIYTLPPLLLRKEETAVERSYEQVERVTTSAVADGPTGPLVPVDSLGQTAELTQCPSCDEVVFTETHSRAGEATWVVCCLCALSGCVFGCCLIPFFTSRLKDVHHQCPQCRANIHTYMPF